MNTLTTLRIVLTIGAIAGIAPVTGIFILGLPVMVLAIFETPVPGWATAAIVASLVGLWGCWKAYAAAMASCPQRHDWKVIAAVLVAIAWGVTWAAGWGWNPWILALFLMPGSTAAIMLAVTARRARQNAQACEVAATADA